MPENEVPSGWTTARLLRLWFGLHEEVSRRAYIASGFGLAALKYAIEAGLIGFLTGRFYSPLAFVSPLLMHRTAYLEFTPQWVGWFQFLLTMVCEWIAVSMSVRRAANAGASPGLGLLVLVPFFNLLAMFVLCLMPTSPHRVRLGSDADVWRVPPRAVSAAARAVLLSLVVGALFFGFSVYALNTYGAALFMGTPLMMGVLAGYFYNRLERSGYVASVAVGLLAMVLALALLLAFALEGAVCILMAAPLLLPLAAVGGALGKAIADAQIATDRKSWLGLVAIPLIAVAERGSFPSQEFLALTTVEIDAPPAAVWRSVVEFPHLPAPEEWYFRAGIASPQGARISGHGVGAIRHCEFTTGTFVEPITFWDEPVRLAFDVAEQPEPMFELSPYQAIHPPHLKGTFRSRRGEFRLIELPGGRTRLEGRTWYTLDMLPSAYWVPIADWLIHRIHERVLSHIKREVERSLPAAPRTSSLSATSCGTRPARRASNRTKAVRRTIPQSSG